jgi:membrane associated rhomboid family serine protease
MPYYYEQSRPQIPPVTLNIIILNALVFFATLINEDFMIGTFGLFYPTSRFFHWWQPLTHMFMHGGFWHIFFNMYTLFIFGIAVEKTIGSRKFLLFYLLCGLGAAALHLGVQAIRVSVYMNQMAEGVSTAAAAYGRLKMIPTVGASGAVYGVLLSYAFLYPQNRMMLIFPPISLSAKWMVTIFLAIELLTGVTGTADGIAHFAHLGGALVGWLLMLYWRNKGTTYNQGW